MRIKALNLALLVGLSAINMHEDGRDGGFRRCQCINLTYISLSASLLLAVCLTPQRLERSGVMKETSVMGCQVLKISLEATGRDIQTHADLARSRRPLLLLTPDSTFNKPPLCRC